MTLNVAVQMDPIARINIRGDSTFALLLEAQNRGYGLSYYTPDRLSQVGDDIVAPVQLLTVRDEAGDHFTLGEPKRTSLRSTLAMLKFWLRNSQTTRCKCLLMRPKMSAGRRLHRGRGRFSISFACTLHSR